MHQCLLPRRFISAREEEEREKTEPALTRQSLADGVQEAEQPKVENLDEKPEEQAECPRGCGQRYPARLPGSSSLLPSVLITLLMLLSFYISFSFITSPSREDETSPSTEAQRKCAEM